MEHWSMEHSSWSTVHGAKLMEHNFAIQPKLGHQNMGLLTAVIGSYPKPEELGISGCVKDGKHSQNYMLPDFNHILDDNEIYERLKRVTKSVVEKQIEMGIDVITNGEIARENYIYTFLRYLQGFDFENPVWVSTRDIAAAKMLCVQATDAIKPGLGEGFLSKEWKLSKDLSLPVGKNIKITVPGPMTIADSTSKGSIYDTKRSFAADLVKCINKQILEVIAAGCKHIQIDEAVIVRYPESALEYGIQFLKDCFQGLPDDVTKTVHICCGYPFYLDQKDYVKADPEAYLKIASALDEAGFDEISIEDAHRRNSPILFQKFIKTKVVLGVIEVASSRIETVEEIRDHIADVLKYIPKERLIIAPDCGLVYLTEDMIFQKLTNMVAAAKQF